MVSRVWVKSFFVPEPSFSKKPGSFLLEDFFVPVVLAAGQRDQSSARVEGQAIRLAKIEPASTLHIGLIGNLLLRSKLPQGASSAIGILRASLKNLSAVRSWRAARRGCDGSRVGSQCGQGNDGGVSQKLRSASRVIWPVTQAGYWQRSVGALYYPAVQCVLSPQTSGDCPGFHVFPVPGLSTRGRRPGGGDEVWQSLRNQVPVKRIAP